MRTNVYWSLEGRPEVANVDTCNAISFTLSHQVHAQCLPEANLATIRSVVCHSQPALSHDHQTHGIDYRKISCHVYCKHIQL